MGEEEKIGYIYLQKILFSYNPPIISGFFMPKNDIIENIQIEKLIFGGKGLATAPDGRKIIIS
jgi:hypothetical protein